MVVGALDRVRLWLAVAASVALYFPANTTGAATPTVKVKTLKAAPKSNKPVAKAEKDKVVSVEYTGWLYDSKTKKKDLKKQFDSSVGRGPITFQLGSHQVIPGWEEGLLAKGGIKVGEKRELTIPPELGYGERGTPDGKIPPNSTLVFDVELKEVK